VSVMTNYSIKKFKIAHLIFAFTEKMFLKWNKFFRKVRETTNGVYYGMAK
jgi:hypothetical protein